MTFIFPLSLGRPFSPPKKKKLHYCCCCYPMTAAATADTADTDAVNDANANVEDNDDAKVTLFLLAFLLNYRFIAQSTSS